MLNQSGDVKSGRGKLMQLNTSDGVGAEVNSVGGKKIFLKVMTLSNSRQKINDCLGNPVEISIDVMWFAFTLTIFHKNYNNKTSLWSPGWSADQGSDGKVFGFFYSTWGINFTLMGNSLADSSAEAKVGNGIYGDYAVCEGPQPYYWGGTWICAAKGTDNVPFIRDLMYRLTCDAQTMKQITMDTLDYTNNQTAMNEIANSDYSSDFLGGQNHIALFAEAATKIDMSNVGPYDSGLNEKFQSAMHEYFEGNVDYDTALDNFYRMVLEKYPELSR